MRGKRNKKRHLIKSMDKPNEKKAFSFPLERDYRRAEPSSDEKAVEFVRSLREKGFFTLYEAMCARMTRVVVPEHQAAFERLVGLLDRLARTRGGRIRANVDTTVFEASAEVILPFFEFGNPEEKALLRLLPDAYNVSFEPTDDGCVRLRVIAPYFEMVLPEELPMDEQMTALLEELFGDDF